MNINTYLYCLKMDANLLESDILFTPDKWSKRFASNVIFEKHVEIITQYSEDVSKQLPCVLNISYGDGQREVIDIYGTDLPDDAPLFLHIHGGYWQEELLTNMNHSFSAKCLYKHGIKSLIIDYELCPNLSLADVVIHFEKAIHKCLDYAKEHKSSGLHLLGHSAGAHLVALLFKTFVPSLPTEDQKLFKSAFLLCGLYDLVPLLETQVNQILELDEDSAKALSPLRNPIFGYNTNFYVLVAQHDSPVFEKQGKQFNDYLLSLGLSCRFILIEDVDHYDIIEKVVDEDFQVTKLILSSIKG